MAATTIYRPIEILLAGVSDSNGVAVDSGKVRFYSPNTVVTQTVWQDEQGTVAWPQPIELNANGQAVVYAKENVRMVVKDSTEFVTYIDDTITAIRFEQVIGSVTGFFGGDQSSLQQFFQAANSSFGQGFQYLASTTSAFAVARNYTAVLKERAISVKDFGATGNGTTDDAPSVRAAIAELKLVPGGTLWVPAGTYKLNDELLFDFNGWNVAGPGFGSAKFKFGVNNKGIRCNAVTDGAFMGITVDSDIAGASVPAILLEGATSNINVRGCKITHRYRGIEGTAGVERLYIADNAFDNVSAAGTNVRLTDVQRFVIRDNIDSSSGGAASFDVELLGSTSYGTVVYNNMIQETGIKVDAAATGAFFIFGPNIVDSVTTPLFIAATGDIQAAIFSQVGNGGGTGDSSSYSIAAATGLFAGGRDFVNVTGTIGGGIDNMQNSYVSHIRTLKFNANVTVNNGGATSGNLRPFALSAAFAATANDTLTVRYDGATWREIGRAVI